MNKNHIFVGVIGAALLVAALANVFASEDDYDGNRHLRVSYGDDHEHRGSRSRSGRNATIEFNGETIACDADTGQVVLEHEDGSKTTVTCD